MTDARSHLELLLQLIAVARPSVHFPDVRGVTEWVRVLATAWASPTAPQPVVHSESGLPERGTLDLLHERQRLARAWFSTRGAQPDRSSEQFNAALAAAHLWSPGIRTAVMTADRARSRLLVTHDAFTDAGTLVRFSVQLSQVGQRHVEVDRSGVRCAATGPFELAVEKACADSATAAAVQLAALEGLTVHEVVRGELGPFVSEHAGRLHDLAPGVLSLVVERVGEQVKAERCADAWPDADAHAERRAALGLKRSRERRLVCVPERLSQLEALAAEHRMLVRSR